MTKRLWFMSIVAGSWLAASAGSYAQLPSPAAEAHFNLGNTHLREGRAKQAIEEFERALKLSPKNPYYLKGLGLAYLARNDYSRAIEIFRKALAINPYYVDIRNDLGTALILSGNREEGKNEILAVYHDPTNPTPELSARNLAQAYFEERRFEDALNWFQASVSRNAAYPDAQIGVASVLLVLGRLDQAIVHLEQALKATSENVDVVLALGEAYLRAGRFTDARQRLQQVVDQSASNARGRKAVELMKRLPR